jgi:hypothetical protein
MCYRCIFDLDAPLFAEIKEFRASEIGPQVGIPNLNIISCMNSTALAEVKEAMGLYSIHLVNLSMATNT